MRCILLAVLLTAALAGCASVRKGLGEYQKVADRGVTIGGPPIDAAGSAPEQARDKGKKPELPGGLGGDKAHPDYTAPPQT